ncbi:hypothetical protein ASF43_25650 [Pseudorhodoferax sp. Leaf267]|nr:hypothetical protein ASF43_25650 [Pseudorhodoferax sp. Leaf267]
MVLLLSGLCCCLALPARAQPAALGLDLRETLAGIITYTRWPTEPDPVRLCLMGSSPQADTLEQQGLPRNGHAPVSVRRPLPEAPLASQCDALYVGTLEPSGWLALLPAVAGQPVLTVCERSDACTAGGMVRLDSDAAAGRVRFEVNLDAVARSTVRIHPLVLKLGRRAAGKAPP